MNRVEGGTCEDKVPYDYNCPYVGASDGNKRVLVAPYSGAAFSWRDESKTFNLNIRSTYVSSSTSVVKDGVCSGDTLTSRWSAVGTTAAGRLVFCRPPVLVRQMQLKCVRFFVCSMYKMPSDWTGGQALA